MRALGRLLRFRGVANVRKLHASRARNSGLFRHDGNIVTVTFVQNSEVVLIDRITHNGFMLNNGIFAVGPVMLFPKMVLSWNVGTFRDISEESLVLCNTVVPKIDMLVLGIDERVDHEIYKRLKDITSKINVQTEIHYVRNATPMYNFLATDGRYVAAALIPPVRSVKDTLYLQSQQKQIGNVEPSGKIKTN